MNNLKLTKLPSMFTYSGTNSQVQSYDYNYNKDISMLLWQGL